MCLNEKRFLKDSVFKMTSEFQSNVNKDFDWGFKNSKLQYRRYLENFSESEVGS